MPAKELQADNLARTRATFPLRFFSPFGSVKGLHRYSPERVLQKAFILGNLGASFLSSYYKLSYMYVLPSLYDGQLALKMGKEGRRIVEEKFTWSQISDKIFGSTRLSSHHKCTKCFFQVQIQKRPKYVKKVFSFMKRFASSMQGAEENEEPFQILDSNYSWLNLR